MVKLLLQPYFILLFSVLVVLIRIVIKYQKVLDRKTHRSIGVVITLIVLMWLFSISVVTDVIERSLYLVSSADNFRPEVITILSGGYEPGYSFEEDILVMETQIRVLKGVKRWKENPEALLIMSGAEYIEGRNNSRLSDLMTNMAVIAGVQKHKILSDTLSRNTFEHPQRILDLPGVSPQSLVEVVTSQWHMRRAIWSFQKFFTNVQPSPFSPAVVKTSKFTWQGIIPYPGSLSRTTTMIHEWIGLLWYKLKR